VVSDIRRNVLRNQEGVDDQRQLVGDTSVVDHMLNGVQAQTRLAPSANYLPLRRGPVSDVTS
jgi:hypothetical protein